MTLCAPNLARALDIVPVYDSTVTSQTNAAAIESAFNAVAADFDAEISTPITVNIDVSWGKVAGATLPASAVGASETYLYGYFSYKQVGGWLKAAAAANPSDTALVSALASLPATAPSGTANYVLPSAEAKAIGVLPANQTGADGFIGFAGTPSGYSFSGPIAAGTYDFQAVAAHEIEEVLGRISGITGASSPAYRTVFDLFRYSAPGILSDSFKATAYYSIDGGKTNLASFNTSTSGGDRGDWSTPNNTYTDIQDAFIYKGVQGQLTTVDLTALDTLGYGGSNLGDTAISAPRASILGLTSDVPEAPVWAMMILGLGATGGILRGRAARPATA